MTKISTNGWLAFLVLSQKVLLGILQLVVFGETAGFYQVVVDAARLDGVDQFQYCQAAADLLVLITAKHTD